MNARLNRLFAADGRCFDVAVDHGFFGEASFLAGIEDMEAAVTHYRGAAGRREDAFQKSVAEHKSHTDVLNRKFDEMLKQAKENPDEPPPKRDIDL